LGNAGRLIASFFKPGWWPASLGSVRNGEEALFASE
jgi:hypothetical protein